MRIRPAQIRRRLALPALALSAVASITFAGGAEGVQAAAAPSADAVKRSAARGTTALGDSGSRYPAGVSRPRKHGGSAPRASPAAAKKRAKKPRKPKLRGNPARALLAFEAMQRYYYVRGSGLYAGEPFSYLWPFSQALAATVSMSNIAGLPVSLKGELHARLIGLRTYLDQNNSGAPEGTYTSTLAAFDGTVAPPVGPGGAKYYDDNDWIGIELARNYSQTHNAGSLGYAQGIMAFEMAGYSTDPSLACPGGIPFSNDVDNTDRNTITTAPAAELAVQLYKITGDVQYLQFAETAYNWVRTCLLQPNNLYADHIRPRGVIDRTFWSYNQGVMIGAGTLLYQATGNSAYLYQARQTAQAALAYFTPQRLGEENPFFPSIYFRNLLYMDSVTHDPPGKKIAQAYVDYAWQHLRLSNNLFVAGSPASAQLLYQAAIVQIYALLSSSPSTYF
ncbi:MAG TPA: glycoside hydrolase family 76 protein [Solirubrobacteraceae bacterium]|nr:glycoside hydrolase family 76 protein [Solirubrobacteraceae bacterium]